MSPAAREFCSLVIVELWKGSIIPRSKSAGIRLSERDAAIVKGMLARGDRQSDIAAFFKVNGGRICEVNTGAKFAGVRAAPPDQLPPPGSFRLERIAGWGLHPLESAALSRRTPVADVGRLPLESAALSRRTPVADVGRLPLSLQGGFQ
jgi:hypothetical protein